MNSSRGFFRPLLTALQGFMLRVCGWVGFNLGIKMRVFGWFNYETPNRYVLENARIISKMLDLSNLSLPAPAQPCWQGLWRNPLSRFLKLLDLDSATQHPQCKKTRTHTWNPRKTLNSSKPWNPTVQAVPCAVMRPYNKNCNTASPLKPSYSQETLSSRIYGPYTSVATPCNSVGNPESPLK